MLLPLRWLFAATLMLVGTAAQAETVVATKVNCRAAARTTSPVLGVLHLGDVVSVLSSERGWSYVDPADLPACWVRDDLLGNSAAYAGTVRRSAISKARATHPSRLRTSVSHHAARTSSTRRTASGRRSSRSRGLYDGGGSCPCSGSNICVGPRGGR